MTDLIANSPPFGRCLERLLDAARDRSAAFQRELEALPAEQVCARHPTELARLNVEASFAAALPVYRCALCADAVRQARFHRAVAAAGIPEDVRHATLANFEENRPGVRFAPGFQTPAQFRQKADAFRTGELRNLILYGTPGIGKGHLAAAIALERLRAGHSVRWIECARLFSDWHAAYEDSSSARIRDRHARAGLLVLDEICLRDLPADGEEILFAILDRRHKAALPTLFLGNQPAALVKKWLGGRLVDRLRSGGVAFCYGEWQSMRGRQGDGAEF